MVNAKHTSKLKTDSEEILKFATTWR